MRNQGEESVSLPESPFYNVCAVLLFSNAIENETLEKMNFFAKIVEILRQKGTIRGQLILLKPKKVSVFKLMKTF